MLQRIWLQGAFDALGLRDSAGRLIEIESPGRWNRLEGPDFKEATLIIDGERRVGDVEIHFSQGEWRVHGHDVDPRYDRVLLHVVYHPIEDGQSVARTASGESIPCVSLMERLWYSLEEYACEDSIVSSTGVDLQPEVSGLLALSLEERKAALIDSARQRWEQKRRYAALRIDRLGWEGACHQSAMEIMGYARNRIPMLILAASFSLEQCSACDPKLSEESLFEGVRERWRLSGCRPSNHPRERLRQYLNWARQRPAWPARLKEEARVLRMEGGQRSAPGGEFGSLARKGSLQIDWMQRQLVCSVMADQIAVGKAATLVCDGFLPLLEAEVAIEAFEHWFHWPAGNAPEQCRSALKQAEILRPRVIPLSNGWIQGMLGIRQG